MHIKNNYKTKYKFVVTLEWWYRGSPEEHYEYSLIQPYKKAFKPYIPYCVVGGAGADGVEITGYPTLKQAILAGFNVSEYCGFDKRQKRHLNKILNKIQKEYN